jgi:hypothetical protein
MSSASPPDRAFASVVQAKFEYEYSGDVFTQAAAVAPAGQGREVLPVG